MQVLSPTPSSPFSSPEIAGPQFGNGWQRLISKVGRGGEHLNTLLSKIRNTDTFQSLQYSKDFTLEIGEVFPAAVTASVLLYLLGQQQRELDDPKAPLRLLAESAAVYALTTYTSYVIPVLGLLGITYTAGQQETVLDKIKHSGVAALGTLGSLLGTWFGVGINMNKTQRDVAKTLEWLPDTRAYLKNHATKLINAWEPEEIPNTLKTPKAIAAYKTQLRQDILQHLKDFEKKLTNGHEALLKTYQANPKGASIVGRIRLRQQLSTVFSELWNHLKPAHEALSLGRETPGLTSALKLSRRLETMNAGYVRAVRWANPIFFGVLGSLAFQLLTPAWEHLCDWILTNRVGHARLELPSHTLLNHHGDEASAGHSNVLWQQHLNNRFNAFAGDGLPQDPFSETTHQETLLTQAGEGLLDRAIHGPF